MARSGSAMPGPWSTATTSMPFRVPLWATLMISSPVLAYWRMFRASSEIAVAIRAWSLSPKPSSAARARPPRRASTMSTSLTIGIRSSSDTSMSVQQSVPDQLQPVVQVQGRAHSFQEEPQLDHGESDRGLNAHDHGLGAFQPHRARDVLQRPGGEGVDDVEAADVDDHRSRPVLADPFGEFGLEAQDVGVRQRRG